LSAVNVLSDFLNAAVRRREFMISSYSRYFRTLNRS